MAFQEQLISLEGKHRILFLKTISIWDYAFTAVQSPMTRRKEIMTLCENYQDCESCDILQEIINPARTNNSIKAVQHSSSSTSLRQPELESRSELSSGPKLSLELVSDAGANTAAVSEDLLITSGSLEMEASGRTSTSAKKVSKFSPDFFKV